jgi:predicted alpha-1,2-mannosidase
VAPTSRAAVLQI